MPVEGVWVRNEISGCALPLKHNYTTDQRRFHVDKDIMITCFPFFRDIIVGCSIYFIFNFLEGALTAMHNKMKIFSAKSLAYPDAMTQVGMCMPSCSLTNCFVKQRS